MPLSELAYDQVVHELTERFLALFRTAEFLQRRHGFFYIAVTHL